MLHAQATEHCFPVQNQTGKPINIQFLAYPTLHPMNLHVRLYDWTRRV